MEKRKRGRPKKEPPIKVSMMSPEELEYYRNLKPNPPERTLWTTAPQAKKRNR